jgi:hypothetical protein
MYKLEGRGILALNVFLRKLQLAKTAAGMTGNVSLDRYTGNSGFQINKYPK